MARRGGERPDRGGDYLSEVEARRVRAQALMGPLDGMWRLVDDRGATLLELSVTDRGPDRALEGVWRGSTVGGAPRSFVFIELDRTDGAARLRLSSGIELDLSRTANGWIARLSDQGETRAAHLVPVGP